MRDQIEAVGWKEHRCEGLIEEIQANPASYVGAARKHVVAMGDDRGALFAVLPPEEVIMTFYVPQGEVRAMMRDWGSGWLRWYKKRVRPAIRTYDVHREAVVLVCEPGGPRVAVVSSF